MSILRPAALAATLIASCLLCHPAMAKKPLAAKKTKAPSPEMVQFTFAPPDGTRFEQTYTVKKTRTVGKDEPRTEIATVVSEGQYQTTPEGYVLTSRTLSTTKTRNGKVLDDGVLKLMAQISPKVYIDHDAQITKIEGYDAISKLTLGSMPAQVAKALEPLLNEQALIQREKGEWNSRMYAFADTQLPIGKTITQETETALPTGQTLIYQVRSQLTGWRPCAAPAGRCIEITQTYSTDSPVPAQMSADLVNSFTAQTGVAPLKASDSRIEGKLVRLLDPNTMLIYDEVIERTITMTMDDGDGAGPTKARLHELRIYTYRYLPELLTGQ